MHFFLPVVLTQNYIKWEHDHDDDDKNQNSNNKKKEIGCDDPTSFTSCLLHVCNLYSIMVLIDDHDGFW